MISLTAVVLYQNTKGLFEEETAEHRDMCEDELHATQAKLKLNVSLHG